MAFQCFFPGARMPVDEHGYINEFELAPQLNNHILRVTTNMCDLIQPEITKENISGLDLTDDQQKSIDQLLQKIKEADELRTKYNSNILDIINSHNDDCLDE